MNNHQKIIGLHGALPLKYVEFFPEKVFHGRETFRVKSKEGIF